MECPKRLCTALRREWHSRCQHVGGGDYRTVCKRDFRADVLSPHRMRGNGMGAVRPLKGARAGIWIGNWSKTKPPGSGQSKPNSSGVEENIGYYSYHVKRKNAGGVVTRSAPIRMVVCRAPRGPWRQLVGRACFGRSGVQVFGLFDEIAPCQKHLLTPYPTPRVLWRKLL